MTKASKKQQQTTTAADEGASSTMPVLPWIAMQPQQGGSNSTVVEVQPSTSRLQHRSSMRSTVSRHSLTSASSMAGASDVHMVKRGNGGTIQDTEHAEVDVDRVKKLTRWPIHKWWILLSNTLLFLYGLVCLVIVLLTFFKFYLRADVFIFGQPTILHLITAMGAICLITSILGYTGIMLNNRALLAIYNLLLWVCLGVIASIGYTAYRKNKWNIEGKLSYQWHYGFSQEGRAAVQVNLHCCGYKDFTDYHERSNKCYPRTLLPGCRFKYILFTKQALTICWIAAFSVLPLHIFVMVSALLCANHVNRTFGKGLPPKIYRPKL